VSLERFDDDPAILLRVLAHAYGQIDPGRTELVAEVEGEGTSLLGRVAPRLAAAFGTSPAPFVLFLDDLHELRSEDCHDVLGVIIAKLPAGSQLVSASRFEQPHLPRLRTSGHALEFVAADLALDAAGAEQIFASVHVTLAQGVADTMIQRTEGWPAGVHLAAMIAKENNGQEIVVTGDDRYVADYLYREFWSQMPADLQRFLRSTAILDQLDASLCDAVLGSSNGAEQLRRLEASSSFVIPLDRRRHWYRYHALFREFLLSELRRNQADDIETLHLRAAEWYEQNGARAMAVEHLLHTTERQRAAQLVTQLCVETYQNGQLSTSLRWLSTLGDASIQSYPPLAVQAAWEYVLTGDSTRAERWWTFVEGISFDEIPVDGTASLDSARAMLRAAICPSGPDEMMADALFAVDHEPPGGPWRDVAVWLLAEAQLVSGQVDEALKNLAEANRIAAALGYTDTVVICATHFAQFAMDRGDWKVARDQIDVALAKIAEKHVGDYVMSALAYPATARLALHDGDVGEAQVRLVEGMRARARATYLFPFIAVRLRIELAKLYVASSNPNAARQLLREIDEIFTRRPNLGTLVDQTEELRSALLEEPGTGSLPLTPAELRVLPYLQTHLTLAAIGQRLFVSRPTVSSQVTSIYRKLGVSSRQAAVERATSIGLLGG
jgi:LuxR family maltose regulon positive regulatory protein